MSTYPAVLLLSESNFLGKQRRPWEIDDMEEPQIFQPKPRRPFDVVSVTSDDRHQLSLPMTPRDVMSRSSSVMNLTSSTLCGIYAAEDGDEDAMSPQDVFDEDSLNILDLPEDLRKANSQPYAQTLQTVNSRPRNLPTKPSYVGRKSTITPLILQTCSLFIFGIGFGTLVTHLQHSQQIAPMPIPSLINQGWGYQLTWGLLGVMIGNALPRIDAMLGDNASTATDGEYEIEQTMKMARSRSTASDMIGNDPTLGDSETGLVWQSAVRSIGAFIGIAFAVRRVPWQSTLQVSLTLAAANPVLWYLIDRSKSGFALSSMVGIVGTFLLLLVNPDFVPLPAIYQDQASEQLGVFTWLASILFCTSLCFGAIGRKLQL